MGSRLTKGDKNGTGSSLADARNKKVVPGRYKKAGKYLLRVSKWKVSSFCLIILCLECVVRYLVLLSCLHVGPFRYLRLTKER